MFKRFSLKSIDRQLEEQGFSLVTGTNTKDELLRTLGIYIGNLQSFGKVELEYYLIINGGKDYKSLEIKVYNRCRVQKR
ncbi:MAG TPA: hypothetical protein VJH95_04970 [Candidatus Nanoarchaeia archaeon]|nr:hypothetical protein [Candidatus Nanoarchaeia archaeon]